VVGILGGAPTGQVFNGTPGLVVRSDAATGPALVPPSRSGTSQARHAPAGRDGHTSDKAWTQMGLPRFDGQG
jgi:hypothetical protein